ASNQAKAKPGAELSELLAYSGCRLGEASALRWKPVNSPGNLLAVPDTKTESSCRVIPMSEPLRDLLLALRRENPTAHLDNKIVKHASARKCLATACRKPGFPRFTHHGLRHFFATACVESGVDIPTVSRWLGHKDGGALAMRVYGHLREAHSDAMVAQVSFATKDAKIVPMPDISGFHQSSGT